jgi:hypothetical protein
VPAPDGGDRSLLVGDRSKDATLAPALGEGREEALYRVCHDRLSTSAILQNLHTNLSGAQMAKDTIKNVGLCGTTRFDKPGG